jgi:hypothetical protein
MCFQELQANSALVKLHLQTLSPHGHVVLDAHDESDCVGSAIVTSPSAKILDFGSKGDSTCSWIKLETVRGPIHIGSVYAPANRSSQVLFWQWLKTFIQDGNWFLAGDFDMVGLPEDSFGPSAILHGAELCHWHSFIDQHDLLDLYLCASRRRGAVHTRQAQSGLRTDSARLDRFTRTTKAPGTSTWSTWTMIVDRLCLTTGL